MWRCVFLIYGMQTKREHKQQEMMLLPSMESLIPKDYYLRRLDRVLDLGFVHDAVRDRYCQDNGRPSIDPEVVVRLFLIQAMDGISHVRELMRQVQVNLAYRWFIGYRLDEKLPDHSTLSKALDRFGDEVFNELFERSISQCKRSGLIEGKVMLRRSEQIWIVIVLGALTAPIRMHDTGSFLGRGLPLVTSSRQ